MEIQLAIEAPDATTVTRDLMVWLTQASALRGRVHLDRKPSEPGKMGALSDTLVVAVGAGGTLTVLANALSVWLRHPRRAKVTVSVERADGTRVDITADHVRTPEEVEALLRLCLPSDREP